MAKTALEYAESYLAHGWQPIAVPRGSKNPGYKDWEKTRLTKSDLPKHFSNGKNIGFLLGEPSGGLVDVDLDCPFAARLARKYLPATGLISGRKSSPDSHFWYIAELPTEKFIDPACADRKQAMIVEIRSTGAQTLVEPSIHPSGETYEWSKKPDPSMVKAASLRTAVSRLAASALLARYWADGKRHELALAVAGTLLRAGWNLKDAADFICFVAEAADDPEVEDRRQSVSTTQARLAEDKKCSGLPTLKRLLPAGVTEKVGEWLGINARAAAESDLTEEWEPPAAFYEHSRPEFPLDALPYSLRQFVQGSARETQTPCDMSAILALSVCAGAIGGRVAVQARPGWIEPTNIYGVVIMPPGERKSAVFKVACEPLEELERELVEEKRDEIAARASEFRMLEERKGKLEKDAAKTDNPEERKAKAEEAVKAAQELAAMKVPVTPRLLASDVTPEVLATLLSDHGGRMSLFSPEGDLFEMLAGRYHNGTPHFDVILKSHCGDTLRIDRRGRSEFVQRPALTIGLAVQPNVVQGLAEKQGFRGRGLLGRFLYVWPCSLMGSRRIAPEPLTSDVRQAYMGMVKALARLESQTDRNGLPVPRMLYLTSEANSLLQEFESELEPKLADDAELGTLADWAGKLAGAVVRLAGILWLIENAGNLSPWPEKISADAMGWAIELGRYLTEHARITFAEMGADEQVENAKRLLRWIEKTETHKFTRREVHQAHRSRFKTVDEIDPALDLLESHNYIRAHNDNADKRPGRKASQAYDANPFVFSEGQPSRLTPAMELPNEPRTSTGIEVDEERLAIQEEGRGRYEPVFDSARQRV